MFDNSKQKALKELLEVLGKGIDLLANEGLDRDLYEAFEKYADSTMKMVNEAYNGGYMSYFSNPFMSHSYFNRINPINCAGMSMPHSVSSIYHSYLSEHNNSAEYRNKLKNLLKQLILLAQKVVYE